MEKMIYKDSQKDVSQQFIVRPVSGKLKILLDNRDEIDFSTPKKVFEIIIEQIDVVVSKTQFRTISDALRSIASNNKRHAIDDRPLVKPSKDPRAWWKYTINLIIADIREKRKAWSWDRMMEYRRDRHFYRFIYKKRRQLGKRRLKDDEKAQLELIERKYSYDDIILFRKLANMDKKKEKREGKKIKHNDEGDGESSSSKHGSKLIRKLEKSITSPEHYDTVRELYESLD